MFIPSERNWEEMKYEAAGCWPLPINKGDEFALVTKMPTSSIKAVLRSCPVSLTVARAITPDGVVLAITLKVEDDPTAALMLAGILRHAEEQVALDNILRTGRTIMVFFDEASRPVARAQCMLDESECVAASALLADGVHYAGAWTPLLGAVLDEVQSHSDPQLVVPTKYAPTYVTVPLTLVEFETTRMTTIGTNGEVLEFRLDDPDEGYGLEQSTWHLLENLFTGCIFHSPKVQENAGMRELTDILIHCEPGLCLIEAKAADILTTSLERSTERRAKSVQKQIDKGISQLVGAFKNLRANLPLFTKTGSPLLIPKSIGSIRQGIVMVSEMLPSLDWGGIAANLIAASEKSGAMLHVLDLQELRILVGISRNNPALFAAYLSHRFDIMLERKHAMLRTVLNGPPMP